MLPFDHLATRQSSNIPKVMSMSSLTIEWFGASLLEMITKGFQG